jgi:hypothetical protein
VTGDSCTGLIARMESGWTAEEGATDDALGSGDAWASTGATIGLGETGDGVAAGAGAGLAAAICLAEAGATGAGADGA